MGRPSPVQPFDQYFFGRGTFTTTTISLPNPRPGGATLRSTVLRGLGKDQTKLIASGSVTTAYVQVAGHPFNPPTTRSTHKGPGVEDLTLHGGQPIVGNPNSSEVGQPFVADGIVLDGVEHYINRVKIEKFRGKAIYLVTTYDSTGGDIVVPRISEVDISHCHDGIVAQAVDTQCSGVRLADVRDYGYHDLGGNGQVTNSHFYGCTTAVKLGEFNEQFAPTTGAGHCTDVTASDSRHGFIIQCNDSRLVNCFSQHCWQVNYWLQGPTMLNGCTCYVARSTDNFPDIVGIYMESARCSWVGWGNIKLADYEFPNQLTQEGCTGIRIENSGATIEARIDAKANVADLVGVHLRNFHGTGDPPSFCLINVHANVFKGAAGMWAVKVDQIGTYNEINIWGNTDQSGNFLTIPAHSATNIIRINGVAIPAGGGGTF